MSIDFDLQVARGDFLLRAAARIERGTTVAVLGPNGAGKSTLIRCLAGLESIDAGSIAIDGRIVDDGARALPPVQRDAGVVFQDYALFPHLSVLENVAFGPQSRGAGRAAARSTAQGRLDALGIGELARRRPAQLSGGQAQRVALARALATAPRVLLLDEPLAALDVQTRESVRVELERTLQAFDGCVLLVTHDPLDALLLADRVLVLEQGRIVQDGSPPDLARRPASDYIASLMGVNLLRGTVADGALAVDGGGVIHIADHRLRGRAAVVVRPEAVTIHRQRPEGSARNAWAGVVAGLQPMHDRVRVQVEGAPSIIATVTPDAVAALHLMPGTEIWVSVKAVELDAHAIPAD